MFTYDLSKAEGSLYEFLYKCIKDDILNEKIKENEKMPSKRTLAKNLGVSTTTIENAYDQLISEGYIYALPKRGYFVSAITQKKKNIPRSQVSYQIHVPQNKEPYLFDFSSGKIESKNFPFSIWAKLMRENLSAFEDQLLELSPGGGVYELRSAIAKHLLSFRGMSVDPNQIIIGAGTEYLYEILIKLLGRDQVYGIENPGYKKLLHIYKINGAKCQYIKMDEQGINIEELKQTNAQIAHVSPTHHFPTGITMPVSRRYELLAWANEQEDRYIIEDDYDSEFRLNGKPIPSLQSIDACEKVIYMNTFSKSLATTIRISYMVLPVHLANTYYEKMSFLSCTVSTFEQYTLAAFIKKGYFEKHINRMRLYYGKKRKRVLEVLQEVFPKDEYEVIENDSGLHFILKLHMSKSDQNVKNAFADHKIKIDSIDDYYMEPAIKNSHEYIINYSNIDLASVKKALILLRQIIQA